MVFFSEGTFSRSDAVEVVDSMLFAVEDDPQEKKIRYMAHLIENASFRSSISADTACYYLKVFWQSDVSSNLYNKYCHTRKKRASST